MRRFAILATILVVVLGCDKAKQLTGGGTPAEAAEPPPGERLDLSQRPDILFQVFGERDDPRMIPLAAILGGELTPIVLGSAGWRQFDALYTRRGATFNLFQDGRSIGTVFVRRGMWEVEGDPLYQLPSCEVLIPLAAVKLDAKTQVGFTVEFLASTAQLGRAASSVRMSRAEIERIAAEVGHAAAPRVSVSAAQLGTLEARTHAVATGAGGGPSIITSFLDPAAERGAAGGNTSHLFVIADRGDDGQYAPTFVHGMDGPAGAIEYRRYIDHLDVNGDGIDELMLEGWQDGGDTYLSFLGFRGGRWMEVFRSRPSWCLD